jgi:hypothetical protein
VKPRQRQFAAAVPALQLGAHGCVFEQVIGDEAAQPDCYLHAQGFL